MLENPATEIKAVSYKTFMWAGEVLWQVANSWSDWLSLNEEKIEVLVVTTKHVVNNQINEWQITTWYTGTEVP